MTGVIEADGTRRSPRQGAAIDHTALALAWLTWSAACCNCPANWSGKDPPGSHRGRKYLWKRSPQEEPQENPQEQATR